MAGRATDHDDARPHRDRGRGRTAAGDGAGPAGRPAGMPCTGRARPARRGGRGSLRRLLLAFALVVVGPAGPLAAQSRPDPRFDGVRDLIHRMLRDEGVPSIAVAVAKDGRVIWEEGFGWADREARVAATEHTMYSLASISKPITATGLMQLVEAGRIDLDGPVDDYLGVAKLRGYAGDARGATVRRVANHTAGLPLHYQFYYDGGGYDIPHMDETIARYAIVANPPGVRVQYSNLGFGILDYLVARGSGRDFGEYMRSEVFLPLGMTRTSVGIAAGLAPYASARYDMRGRRLPFYGFDHDGASAVWSSAHDLVRFGMFHLKTPVSGQKAVLRPETVDAMQVPTSPAGGPSRYGIAWNVAADDNGLLRVSHSGGMPGVSTVLNLYPTERLAVVVLANRNNTPVQRVSQEIVAALVPRYAQAMRERQAAVPGPQEPSPFVPGPELLGEWTGRLQTWSDSVTMRLVVQPDGDVHVRLGDQLTALLNGATWRDGNLVGRFAGAVPTPDVARHPHNILVNLWLDGERLYGQASAQSTTDPIHYALTSWVELRRTRAADR
jgi:CubicO group peptidase (beta-lactamase class C family)